MLDRVLSYVRAVLAGETPGDAAVGRYLMDAFGAGAEDIEKGGVVVYLQQILEKTVRDLVLTGENM